MKRGAIPGLLLLIAAASAHAEDARVIVPGSLFGGIVQERDIALIFGYAREAVSAAVEGREVPPPEELTQRAEVLGAEMKRRGAAAGRAIIDAIESAVRERLRDFDAQVLPGQPDRIRL